MFTALANPARFQRFARPLRLGAAVLALLALTVGLWLGLFASPPDYQQGETVRIMYVHVPAAWMALAVYLSMAASGFVSLVWRHPLADVYCRAAAPLGAGFTAICLVTGALWGQPMWGTWWVWDARLTSVLILFFFYLGYIALVGAFDDRSRGEKAGAVLLLVGTVNAALVKFSVDYWNTLHQGASVLRLDGPTIAPDMLLPLLAMALGTHALFVALVLTRMLAELAERRLSALRLRLAGGG